MLGSLTGERESKVAPVAFCTRFSAPERYVANLSYWSERRLSWFGSHAPETRPLFVMKYGAELENASKVSAPRALAAVTHQRWLASASGFQWVGSSGFHQSGDSGPGRFHQPGTSAPARR